MKRQDRTSFNRFLEHILSSRYVSLAIAQDAETLDALVEMAEYHGLARCQDAFDVASRLREPHYEIFVTLGADLPKPLYDFVVQYPTGQVQLQDPATLAPILVAPSWENNAVLILATKNAVVGAEAAGFNFLDAVGMCWQPFP